MKWGGNVGRKGGGGKSRVGPAIGGCGSIRETIRRNERTQNGAREGIKGSSKQKLFGQSKVKGGLWNNE